MQYDARNEFIKAVKANMPQQMGGPAFDALIFSIADAMQQQWDANAEFMKQFVDTNWQKAPAKCICFGPPSKDCPVHGN